MAPTFEIELAERRILGGEVCGVDEAGRGPWAGPVVAAAVILQPDAIPSGLNDSKALSEAARETAFEEITACARCAVAMADVERIDRDNILRATLWAMQQAVAQLDPPPVLALIDGNRVPHLRCQSRAIVRGDARCLSIAAASIVAKVTRDRMMRELGREWPGYGFEKHKGYGTAEHRAAIAKNGVTPHHRRSFRPVQLAIALG